MKKRLLILLLVAAVATGLFLIFGKGRGTGGAIRASGTVEGREFTLAPKVAGTITEICCSEGDPVKEGQEAVRLRSDDLAAAVSQAAAAIERAKADLAASESSVKNAEAAKTSAEADLRAQQAERERTVVIAAEQKLEMERSGELYRKGYIAKADLDQAEALFGAAEASRGAADARVAAARSRADSAAAQVNASKAQVGAAAAGLKETKALLAFQEAKLRDTVLISPASGTVVYRALEKGEHAAPGVGIMTLVDTADLYVRVDLEETLIAPLAVGSAARITAEGIPGKVFPGTITEIGRYAEFATQRDVTRGRQDLRTFRVKVKPDDPGRLLKPGMTVFVEFSKN